MTHEEANTDTDGPTFTSADPLAEFNLTEFMSSLTTKISTEALNLLELLQSFVNQDSTISKWIVTAIGIILAMVLVFAFVAFGWWIVWICFLSRFKFVRELLLGNNNSPSSSSSSSASQASTEESTKSPNVTNKKRKGRRKMD